jgi:hypothetical protein
MIRVHIESIVVALLLLASPAICVKGQNTVQDLAGNRYHQQNNKWYKITERGECRIFSNRLVVRAKNVESEIRTSWPEKAQAAIQSISEELFGGYYCVTILPQYDPFEVFDELYRSNRYSFVGFDVAADPTGTPNDPLYGPSG